MIDAQAPAVAVFPTRGPKLPKRFAGSSTPSSSHRPMAPWTRTLSAEGGGPEVVLLEVDLSITQGAAAMTVEDRGGCQAPVPVKLTYQLDGSVSMNMVAGRGGGAPTEQVSKTMWLATTSS